ncbi:hypothetical protein V3C99_005881, partial [Haemonchus contortus]
TEFAVGLPYHHPDHNHRKLCGLKHTQEGLHTNRPDNALVATDRHIEGAIDRQLDQQTNTSMMPTG